MSEPYPIIDVAAWPTAGGEPLGSKQKVWLRAPDGSLWLFKIVRRQTGDDWAEKAAAELAELLDLPHAVVELAVHGERLGCIGCDFVRATERPGTRLLHGNELLYDNDPSYPKARLRRVAQHTVDRALDILIQRSVRALRMLRNGEHGLSAPEVFVGYLLLDAWIANQDRHHENWGIVALPDALPELAPNYDLAASLGQILGDVERQRRLDTRDAGYAIEAWTAKARSHFYLAESDAKPATTTAAFVRAAERYPAAAGFWMRRLESVDAGRMNDAVGRIPDSRASAVARRFAARMLELNRERLLRLETR